jgi:hypothetical protein
MVQLLLDRAAGSLPLAPQTVKVEQKLVDTFTSPVSDSEPV